MHTTKYNVILPLIKTVFHVQLTLFMGDLIRPQNEADYVPGLTLTLTLNKTLTLTIDTASPPNIMLMCCAYESS